MANIDMGDTAWLLLSAAFVLPMAPAVALVYGAADGGSHRGKSGKSGTRGASPVGQALTILPVVALQWTLFGYSLVFGPTRHGMIGGLSHLGMARLAGVVHGRVPALAFAAFQMACATTAPAILVLACRGRLTRGATLALALFWSTLVYDPIAHWVWADDGWLSALGALDFAGGTVVHLAAGVSALVCALFLGGGSAADAPPRRGPALAGMALLWVGGFALMAGNALATRGLGVRALESTVLGSAGGGLAWLLGEWGRERGTPSRFGVAAGLLVGLVAVIAAGGYVTPWVALTIGFAAGATYCGTRFGLVAGLMAVLLAITAAAGYVAPSMALAIVVVAGGVCYAASRSRERLGDARSLGVFGIHSLGGLVGALLTGIFAEHAVGGAGIDGAIFGNVRQLGLQLLACLATGAYAATATLLVLKVIDVTVGLRSTEDPVEEDDASTPEIA